MGTGAQGNGWDADVAVVGAGPAGGYAARRLASRGLSVTLFDMRRTVGSPVQCGEAVSDVALRENGVSRGDWIVSRVRGVTARAPGTGPAHLKAPGSCIDRRRFDRHLVEEAVAFGADLRTGCQVTAVHTGADGCTLFAAGRRLRSRYVLAADGPTSPTARALGLVAGGRCHLGMQHKFPAEVVDTDPEWLHLFLARRYGGGYAWIFPRGDEVSVGVDVPRDPRAHLASFCRTLGISVGRRRGTNGGRIPVRVRLSRLGRGSVLVAGDAAGATNPIFGGGIHAALSTARMAADAILDAQEEGPPSAAVRYHRRAQGSPFFHPVLPFVAGVLHDVDDAELALAVDLYRRRADPVALLGLLPRLLGRPALVRRLRDLPRLRRALEITAAYGW